MSIFFSISKFFSCCIPPSFVALEIVAVAFPFETVVVVKGTCAVAAACTFAHWLVAAASYHWLVAAASFH